MSLIGQLVRFALVGGLNTAIDWSVYVGLTRFTVLGETHPFFSNGIALVLALSNSFVLNKIWTYQDHDRIHPHQIAKFLTVQGTSALVAHGLFIVLVSYGADDLISKAAVSVALGLWNFFGHRLWTFARHAEYG